MTVIYLTKYRFQLGKDCPTKLFYTGKVSEYANTSVEDTFLAALADGGFQVGELVRQYFSNGQSIETLDHERSVAQTKELLQRDDVVIFEGTFKFDNLLARTDIQVKRGKRIDLIEVKSNSYIVSLRL